MQVQQSFYHSNVIVVDDDDNEEDYRSDYGKKQLDLDFVDLSDYQRPAMFTPTTPARKPNAPNIRSFPQPNKIARPKVQVISCDDDDDVLCIGDAPKSSAYTVAKPAHRPEPASTPKVSQESRVPLQAPGQPPTTYTVRSAPDHALDAHIPPAAKTFPCAVSKDNHSTGLTSSPTLTASLVGNSKTSPADLQLNELKPSSEIRQSTITDTRVVPAEPPIVAAEKTQKEEQTRPVTSQVANNLTPKTDDSDKNSGANVRKPLAERLGFAALPNAKDDPRYAHLCKKTEADSPISKSDNQEAVTSAPATDIEAPVAVPSAPANSKAASAPKAPPKPRAKKPPTKKPDPPPPSYDVLKSNRKRPLSKIPIGVLFTPGQVVSDAGYENAKRQRLEKKSERVLQQKDHAAEKQDDLDILFDEMESNAGADAIVSEIPVSLDASETHIEQDTRGENVVAGDQVEQQLFTDWATTPPKVDNGSDLVPPPVACQGTDPLNRQPTADKEPPVEIEVPVFVSQALTGNTISAATNPLEEKQQPSTVSTSSEVTTEVGHVQKRVTFDLEPSPPKPAPIEICATEVQETLPLARPTTGGKGISAATRAKLVANSDIEPPKEAVTTTPDLVYEYFVSRREWRVETAEDDVMEAILGPFHTVVEANAIARKEVTNPIEHDTLDRTPGNRWNHWFEQDEYGMHTYMVEVCGVHVETTVHRGKHHIPGFIPHQLRI